MDLYATVAGPVEAVFGYLADPSRLNDWLPQVVTDPGSPDRSGADFSLVVQVGGIQVAAGGEVTAFEPPWLVGYRLFLGERAHGIRITCSAQDGGTQIHVHQPDDVVPLTIDLARLIRAIGHPTGEEMPC